MTLKTFPTALGAALLLGSVIAATPAHAGGTNFTQNTGACSMGSTWIMKAKPHLNQIELEFSVDTHVARQTWAVRVTDNKNLVWAGDMVTRRISRSFSVDRFAANRAGIDHFVGRTTNAKTGEVCVGRLAFGG